MDLKIIGGTVVDGTGAPSRRANVGVKDGRIVEIGACEGRAERVIDAEGAIVTPGFTDLHTHYDGQVSWDAEMAPSCLHGVTTCVIGNCGVGFAPARERDRQRLIELMEGVEDIPGAALSEGIQWSWESFGEYLDAIDARPRTIDVVSQVTHDPLRVYVMGERAFAGSAATDDDIAKMRALVREALAARRRRLQHGANATTIARSTGARPRPPKRRCGSSRGSPLPSRGSRTVSSRRSPISTMEKSVDRFDAEFDVLEQMGRRALRGRPMSLSSMQRDLAHDAVAENSSPARRRRTSARIPIRAARSERAASASSSGFEATFHPFIGFPSYKAIATLPLAERVRRMRDPELRARILSEKSEKIAGDGSNDAADGRSLPREPRHSSRCVMYPARGSIRTTSRRREESLPRGESMRAGKTTARGDVTMRSSKTTARSSSTFRSTTTRASNLDAVREMLGAPALAPRSRDGGAHVGTVCDASFPTFMLTHWAKSRDRGRFSVEQVVKMLTHDTSRYIGLTDRGTIAPGQRADLNVIDLEALRLRRPTLVAHLPRAGKRLLQRAEGYRTTLVAGRSIIENGCLTGEMPGRLARIT